jgi:hypothetical protein
LGRREGAVKKREMGDMVESEIEGVIWTGRRSSGSMAFSFFSWLISLFAQVRNNPERARKRGLKRIAKAIAANTYGKFFRVKNAEATPELAQFFYQIYKAVSPAQELLWDAVQSTLLKLRVVENFLKPAQRDLLGKLSAESIEKRAEETEGGLLSRQIRNEFADLERSFDEGQTNAINGCYSLILIIYKFVVYDYYFLLKKFDLLLTEHSFSRKPIFNALRGKAVVKELMDFLELTGGMDPNRDWTVPLRVLGELKGTKAINPAVWNSMLFMIRELSNSEIFELIIRFVEKDPDWTWEPQEAQEDIVGPYLEMIRGEIFDRLTLVVTAKQNVLIDRLATAVFGDVRMNRLNYYTEQRSETYTKKKMSGLTEARALNYLMVFLTDERPEMQELYELLLIRGRWTSMALCVPLSEALWLLLAVFPDRITELDEMLSDRGFYGSKLKTVILNLDRDKSARRSIARYLDSVNGKALQIVNDAIFNLSVLYDGLKGLREDCRKNPGMIIRNWDELNNFSETALENRIVALWNKLTNMLELLRVLVQAAGMEE